MASLVLIDSSTLTSIVVVFSSVSADSSRRRYFILWLRDAGKSGKAVVNKSLKFFNVLHGYNPPVIAFNVYMVMVVA